MKRYQIALLSFALGIFAVTSIGLYFVKRFSREISVSQKTPMPIEYKTLHVFFSSIVKDPETIHCDRVYPVDRAVGRLSDNGKSALAEYAYLALSQLLDGPAGYEKDNGYFTSINEDVGLKSIIIENGIANVDFNDKLGEGVAGSCRVQAIRSQIIETLMQFPEIKEVTISINGKSEEVLQP